MVKMEGSHCQYLWSFPYHYMKFEAIAPLPVIIVAKYALLHARYIR